MTRLQKILLLSTWVSLPIAGAVALLLVPKMVGKDGGDIPRISPVSIVAASAVPTVSLFDSVEHVKTFLKNGAKLDYSDKYLSGVKLAQVESVPRKGTAWVYTFSFKKPRLGGDVVIYHYMDGEMIEFTCGP